MIEFSEDGIKLAVASSKTKNVQVWDLRKQKATKEVELDSEIEDVAFDQSGRFLCISSGGVHILGGKKLAKVASIKSEGVKSSIVM